MCSTFQFTRRCHIHLHSIITLGAGQLSKKTSCYRKGGVEACRREGPRLKPLRKLRAGIRTQAPDCWSSTRFHILYFPVCDHHFPDMTVCRGTSGKGRGSGLALPIGGSLASESWLLIPAVGCVPCLHTPAKAAFLYP